MNQRYSLELKMVLHWALRSRCLLHPDLHLPYYYPCQVTRCPSGLGNCQAETFLHLQRMTAWSAELPLNCPPASAVPPEGTRWAGQGDQDRRARGWLGTRQASARRSREHRPDQLGWRPARRPEPGRDPKGDALFSRETGLKPASEDQGPWSR